MSKNFSILVLIILGTFTILLIAYGFKTTNIDFQGKPIAEKQISHRSYQPTVDGKPSESLGVFETPTSDNTPAHAIDDGLTLTIKLQEEIAGSSDSQIEKQITDLKADIYENNLIDRLNHDSLGASEREKAQVMLARLALLGVERAKRNLDSLIPQMQVSLAKHQENLAKAREILKD